jgi:hypothetical protein
MHDYDRLRIKLQEGELVQTRGSKLREGFGRNERRNGEILERFNVVGPVGIWLRDTETGGKLSMLRERIASRVSRIARHCPNESLSR